MRSAVLRRRWAGGVGRLGTANLPDALKTGDIRPDTRGVPGGTAGVGDTGPHEGVLVTGTSRTAAARGQDTPGLWSE